jgi:hypothetical protein
MRRERRRRENGYRAGKAENAMIATARGCWQVGGSVRSGTIVQTDLKADQTIKICRLGSEFGARRADSYALQH